MGVCEATCNALMGIGNRNLRLNKKATATVKAISPIDIDDGDDNRCEPVDILSISPAIIFHDGWPKVSQAIASAWAINRSW